MMTGRLLVLVFVVGCGGSSEKEQKSCDRAIKLCGYGEGADSCLKDIRESKDAMGENYGKFLECSAAAKTCGEYIGCAAGGIGAEGMKQLEGLQRGMEKMMGGTMRDTTRRMQDRFTGRDDTTTVAPVGTDCTRAKDVCSDEDAEPAAEKCNSALGNVKADPESRTRYLGCIAAAKNCYAFKNCADQLWFDNN